MMSLRKAALVAAAAVVGVVSGAVSPLSLALGQPALSSSASVAPQQRILTGIDESDLVTIAGNTRGEANAQNDRGRVNDSLPMEHMLLLLQRSPEQEAALKQYIDDETNPKSASFHKWLKAADFGSKYGVAQTDLTTVEGWLQGHGFTVNTAYPNRMVIDFSGTAGQIAQAFHTEIHNLSVNGVPHIANMSDPKIPAALAPVVAGVASLHNFMPHTNFKTKAANGPKPDYTTGSTDFPYVVVPADLATIYNLNPLYAAGMTGTGQTIVVIEDTDVYSAADWTTFRTTFGLTSAYPSGTFTTVHPPSTGTNNCSDPGVNGAESEASLDAQWSSAAAPNAAIELASCADSSTTFGGLLALQNLINASGTPPSIVSISYGECEAYNGATQNALYSSTYQQAAGEGVSLFVSSGDESSVSCDADKEVATHGTAASGFTTTPYNVSVGGTDFGDGYNGTYTTYWSPTNTATYGSALSYIPEIPWNDSCASQILETYEYNHGAVVNNNTYGPGSLCALGDYLSTASGSGAPSTCYSGAPTTAGVTSGTCAGQPKPSWQTGFLGNPSDGVRDIPDVSLFASNGWWGHYYVFCDSDGGSCTGAPSSWPGAGGTSFASPILAGMQALVNESAGGAQGLPTPAYYALAAAEYGTGGSTSCNSTLGNATGKSCVFYDVTYGDMNVDCQTLMSGPTTVGTFNCFQDGKAIGVGSLTDTAFAPTYGTATGWDFATGIGTVNAFNLVAAYTGASGVTASAPTATSVTLNWTAPYDAATSYNVYAATTSGGEGSTPLLTGVTGTSATVSGLTPGTTNYFQVTAIDASTGAESVKSAEISATTSPIAAPTNLVVTGTAAGSVSLSWTASPGAYDYYVYYGTSPGNEVTKYFGALAPATTATVTGLASGTTYYFQVNAYVHNTGVTSPASNAVSATTPFTTGPAGLTVTGTAAGQASLSWTALTGSSDYYVYYSTTPTGATTKSAAFVGTTATITGLAGDTTYYFTVQGYSHTIGASPSSNQVSAAIPFTTLPAPTNLAVTSIGTGSVSLSWTGSTGASDYYVYSTPAGGSPVKSAAIVGTSGTISGLVSGLAYTFYVEAYSHVEGVSSTPSNTVGATPH